MIEPGNYTILSFISGNSVNTCPSVAPGAVVILSNVGVAKFRNVEGGYNIFLNDGHVKPDRDNLLISAITFDAPRVWIPIYQEDRAAYFILSANDLELTWTDPGNEAGSSHQLRLAPWKRTDNQLFRLVRVADY